MKKENEEAPAARSHTMTADEMDALVQRYYAAPELYILLSPDKTNWISGMSVPFSASVPQLERQIIYLFSSYEKARKCAALLKVDTVENMYPIARLNAGQPGDSLDVLCSNAAYVGVNFIDFDRQGKDAAFGCRMEYFMEVNCIDKDACRRTGEPTAADSAVGEMQFHFHPLHIHHFTPPERIAAGRARELVGHLFSDEDSGTKFYIEKVDLTELCFLLNYVDPGLVKRAEEQGKTEDAAWFRSTSRTLQAVLYMHLLQAKALYTISRRNGGGFCTKDGSRYILYSNRCANGLHADQCCTRINSLQEYIRDAGESGFIVTDCIHDAVTVPAGNFQKLVG